MSRLHRKKPPHNYEPPPSHCCGWCDLHKVRVNWKFIRKRGCVIRKRCKHFWWTDIEGNPEIKLKPVKEKDQEEIQCEKP